MPDPLVICVRGQDSSNDFYTYTDEPHTAVEIHDIDLGYMDLDDPEEFFPWAVSHLEAAGQYEAARPLAADLIRTLVTETAREKSFFTNDVTWRGVLAAATERGEEVSDKAFGPRLDLVLQDNITGGGEWSPLRDREHRVRVSDPTFGLPGRYGWARLADIAWDGDPQ